MAETKKCRMCKNDIDKDAKKCPYCRSVQSWLYHPFIIVAAILVPYLIMILVLGMMLHDIVDEGEPFENYRDALVISESKLTFGDRNGKSTVVIVGKIQNKSNVNWEYLRLQVNCYNQQGELFDTHYENCHSMLVPGGTTVPFKVSFVREFSKSDYSEHEVVTIHAEDEDGF